MVWYSFAASADGSIDAADPGIILCNLEKRRRKTGGCDLSENRTSRSTRKNDQRLIPARRARRSDESAPSEAASAAASPHHDASGSREGETGSSGECGPWIWPRTLKLNDYRAETGSLPLAPRSRQTCASLPHRVTHRCPWKARRKDARGAEKMTKSHRNNANVHPNCGEMTGRVVVLFLWQHQSDAGSQTGRRRRRPAHVRMSFCIFGEDCVKYEPYQVDGRESLRRGTLTRPLGWKTSPSPRRQGAVLLPWCYVTAQARRKYGWWYLQGMNQRWREGFITPQAAVRGESTALITDMTTANDSNEAVAFAIGIWEGFYLITVNQLLITTILLLIYGCYLLLSSSFIGPPDSGEAPGNAVVTFQIMLVTQSKHNMQSSSFNLRTSDRDSLTDCSYFSALMKLH